MDMTGEQRIAASRQKVWAALNDVEVLRQCIPGCQSIEKHSDTDMTAKVMLAVGPVRATFSGKVTLSDLDPPNGYKISGEGSGGVAGPIDPNLYDKITRGAAPITERPGALVPPALDRIRKTRGPFASDDDVLLAAFYDEGNYSALKAAGPIKTDYVAAQSPLVTLFRELGNRPTITNFSLRTLQGT